MRGHHDELGPDWADIHEYMELLGRFHESLCRLEICPLPSSGGARLLVRLILGAPVLVEPGKTIRFVQEREWPCGQHKRLEGLILAMCFSLDRQVGAQYHQHTIAELFPPTPPMTPLKRPLSTSAAARLDKDDLVV